MDSCKYNFLGQTGFPRYLLLGNGRLSKHFQFYLQSLNIPFLLWDRSSGNLADLQNLAQQATHILLLISDSALLKFFRDHLQPLLTVQTLQQKVIHCSGAVEITGTHSVHPLMTFTHDLYKSEFYPRIPFVTTSDLSLEQLLPGLTNPFYRIRVEQKALYHAVCVLGGNLTALLVAKMNVELQALGLPENVGKLFVQQSLENVFRFPADFFTGPLARKDQTTIFRNLTALEKDPFRSVYLAFAAIVYPELTDQFPRGANEDSRL